MMRYRRSVLSWLLVTLGLVAFGAMAYAAAPPVAVDDLYHTAPDDALSVDAPGVLGNDSDPDGDPLTAILVDSSQADGLLVLNDDGSFEYEPAPAFIGTDTFTYVANDGSADSNEATITFIVTGTLGISTYTDQATFLNDLVAAGYTPFTEGFEDDAVWGDVRTTIVGGEYTAPTVFNQGITWTANNDQGEVTTGEGPARRGQWGFFTLPHGSYLTGENCNIPGNCGDGWRGFGDGRMVAVGGWVETNTPFASINLFLDGNMNAPIDFGIVLGTQYQFVGVITPTGFDQFEFREMEGVQEDAKYIFADDFYFAFETNLFLRSSRIQMGVLSGGASIGGRIIVVDQNGNPAPGATVSAEWTLPDGSSLPVSGVTNNRGRVQWLIPSSGAGEYTLTVLHAVKADHVFLGGVMSRTLVVPQAPFSAESFDIFGD